MNTKEKNVEEREIRGGMEGGIKIPRINDETGIAEKRKEKLKTEISTTTSPCLHRLNTKLYNW